MAEDALGASRPNAEFDALLALSERLGRDIEKTQAAGGNTSLKLGPVMWVKASGTWLADARRKSIMVPVAIAPLLDAFEKGDPRAEKATDFIVPMEGGSELRPSVETTIHALVPWPVVVHIHCVETVALAVRADARARIGERLAGLPGVNWAFIPYCRPGVPLAARIRDLTGPETNVLVLGNHGLVVSANTVAEAGALVDRVSNALASPKRPLGVAKADLPSAEGSSYVLIDDAETQALAFDAEAIRRALGGTMYPDHAIFLGDGPALLPEGVSVAELSRGPAPLPALVIAPGRGVFLRADLTAASSALARCLSEVARRIPADAPVVYLTADEERELTGWEAEHYRRKLDAAASAGSA